MQWLDAHGITSSWFEYDLLPTHVLEDARLLMEYDVVRAEMEAKIGHH